MNEEEFKDPFLDDESEDSDIVDGSTDDGVPDEEDTDSDLMWDEDDSK